MSHLHNFLEEFAQRSGMRGMLSNRLFASMLAGFRASELDRARTDQQLSAQEAKIEQLEASLRESQERIMVLTEELEAFRQQTITQIAQLQASSVNMQELQNARIMDFENLCINVRNNNSTIAALQSDMDLCRTKLTGLERAGRIQASSHVEYVPSVPADTAYDAIDYFDFENHFRGSIARIKEAQRIYLPYFTGKRHVLDIGCGRGEFLSLMQENGIPAEGVDLYAPYIDHCRMQGFSAECGDGIAYLANMNEVDGIFAGQVAEHLTTEQLISLCDMAYEKLAAGGCIVIETPNPTSLAIYTGAFYIDPSHEKPVHPLTLRYFLEKAGFRQIEILYPEQSKPDVEIHSDDPDIQKIKEILFGAQDYAVIAAK